MSDDLPLEIAISTEDQAVLRQALLMFEGRFVVVESEAGNFVGVLTVPADGTHTIKVNDGYPGRAQMLYADEVESVCLAEQSPLVVR